MGKWSSLAPGGGSVYQQLRGGSVGFVTNSTGHKVYLNIAMHSDVVIMGSIEHKLLGKKAERTS